jgi:hypothetical protein
MEERETSWNRVWYGELPGARQEVHDQLPRELRQQLSLYIESTALTYGFQFRAIFTDKAGRWFECILEEDREHKLHIPEAFIAHLCVVV